MNTFPDSFPLEPTSPSSKQASRLHDEIVAAAERVAQVETIRQDAEEAVQVAAQALDNEIIRSGRSGVRSATESKLAAVLDSARALAAPRVHELRRDSAAAAYRDAAVKFSRFCRDNAATLLEEVRPEAEAATAAYLEAQDAAEELLCEPTARRQAAGALVRSLVPCLDGAEFPAGDWTVPEDLGTTPLPPAAFEVIERAKDTAGYDARRQAEADAAARLAEREAAEAVERENQLVTTQEALNRLSSRAVHGRLDNVERDLLNLGEHPLQIAVEQLKKGTLAEARETLTGVVLANFRGKLDQEDSADLLRGNHPAQRHVEALVKVRFDDERAVAGIPA